MDSDQYLIQQLNNNFFKRPLLIDGLIISNLNDYNPSDFFPAYNLLIPCSKGGPRIFVYHVEQPNSGRMKGCYVLTPRRPSSGIICTPDRRAGNGHWRGLRHSERAIYGMDGVIGVKKELCFHTGQPGYRHKTNWKMIEYRLLQYYCSIECNHMKGGLDDWVLCKVYEDFDPDALSSQMGTMDIH